jgi:erythromycin esterase
MAAKKPTARLAAGLLLLASALSLASCSSGSASTPHQTPSGTDAVVRWIQQHAVPLRSADPGGSDGDLAALPQMVGQASLVGLGEETHGTHEFIEVKARLAEYLIGNLGFTTFVMENNWGSTQLLDAYINGGAGDISTIMAQGLFGSWQTREYQALFEWLRAYNANPAHSTKVHFLGMDCQDVSQSDFDAVSQYIQQVDPQQASTVQALYGPIITNAIQHPAIYDGLSAATKRQYQTQAQRVYDLVQAHQQGYSRASSPQRFALALQNARIIMEFATYYNASSNEEALSRYYQRDGFMAENVEWIHDRVAGPHPKLIIWAHDGHIANDTTYGSQDGRNMGGELCAQYQDSYLPIGTTLYQGTFRVYNYPSGIVQTIAPAPSDTYNYAFGHAGLPLYMLDLRTVPSGVVADWASGAGSATRLINYGLGGQDLSLNLLSSASLRQWFAVIVHVQNSTPSQHL